MFFRNIVTNKSYSFLRSVVSSLLHLAVGRRHRRSTPRCPHDLQLNKVTVSFSENMMLALGINHLSASEQIVALFFKFVNLSGKIPNLVAGALLLSFSLFLRFVLKFENARTSL